MQEPQTESCRKTISLFVARALFLLQPPCWGAWSAHCTCRKQKKKKKRRKSTQHNHKSGENSQMSSVSVQSAWRETSSHLPHRLRLLSVILFLSRSQFVFIVYFLGCVLINPFCIESHTKRTMMVRQVLLFDTSDFKKKFELQMLLEDFQSSFGQSGMKSVMHMCDSAWKMKEGNKEYRKIASSQGYAYIFLAPNSDLHAQNGNTRIPWWAENKPLTTWTNVW